MNREPQALSETCFEIEDREISLEMGASALAEFFQHFNHRAVYLMESTARADLGPFQKDISLDLASCISLIICDQDTELRLEKEPFSSEARLRLMREGRNGLQAMVRESAYYVRDPFKKKLVALGDRLIFREYFVEDADGWHSCRASRLAGLKKREAK